MAKLQDSQTMMILENEEISLNLHVKQREYLKLIEETRKNTTLFDGQGGQSEEYNSLKARYNLLSEENHILFEQVTLLRAHNDQFNREVAEKFADAEAKSQRYDSIRLSLDLATSERDELVRANSFMEQRLSSANQQVMQYEELRRNE